MMWLPALLFLTVMVQGVFYAYFLRNLSSASKKTITQPTQCLPVSVIICARNEAANLRKNLPAILRQSYPSYEVIVVDDQSTDDTFSVITEFQKKHTQLRSIKIKEKKNPGKKEALSRGIAAANNELLLLTDADCFANSNYWITEMVADLHQHAEVVLGYSPIQKQHGWLNKIIRFETMHTAILYLSFAVSGKPYMGVGRNMAYKKSLYKSAGGFAAHEKLASGDDDLFVNAISENADITVNIDEASWVIGASENKWVSWWRQKRRHMSTGVYYKIQHLFWLWLFHSCQFLVYLLSLVLIFTKFWWLAVIIVGFKFLLQMTIFKKLSEILGETDLILFVPFLDFLYLIQIVATGLSLILKASNRWK